ncbi:glycosyltransferase family 4 protein [Pistricoccus aurantiacus]|uniref:Glycosyltransferase family 4 protein n=1 Tax=Pistricoccus aurantiacus TaxID=1883414 RepID=A0A5B8SVY6_9GAMM|nr:glycosyltransferase [Pistricoccus aurantiacus]QEA39735.1 glycosyltransferase family 4 protein [Pistricoccus aurantiacus]
MSIIIIAPVHAWDDVRVFKKQAVSLARSGFDVKLIARIEKKDFIDGVEVIPPAGSSKNRFLRFLSIPLISFQALFLKGEIYHLHNPDTIPIAFFLRLFGSKIIYDTHEDFTQRILSRYWLPKILRGFFAWAVGRAEVLTARVAQASIATQREVAERLGNKCLIIKNLPRVDDELIEQVSKLTNQINDKGCIFRVVYIGGVSPARGLYEMVDALPKVNEEIDCRLWLIGRAQQEFLESASKRKGWDYVDYFSKMAQEKAFAYVKKSDIGLIYINDVGGHAMIDPNKIYEYMTFSKPFVASNFKKWREDFEGINAGVFIEPGSSDKLSESLLKLARLDKKELEKMGNNGKKFVDHNNWEKEYQRLLKIYEGILGCHSAS